MTYPKKKKKKKRSNMYMWTRCYPTLVWMHSCIIPLNLYCTEISYWGNYSMKWMNEMHEIVNKIRSSCISSSFIIWSLLYFVVVDLPSLCGCAYSCICRLLDNRENLLVSNSEFLHHLQKSFVFFSFLGYLVFATKAVPP